MPDIFVPMDTTAASPFYRECRRKGLLSQFSNYWADQHRTDTLVADFNTYLLSYDSLGIDSAFILFTGQKGVSFDSILAASSDTLSDSVMTLPDSLMDGHGKLQLNTYDHFLYQQIKGLLADRLFGRGHYYRIMKDEDPVYKVAVETLRRRNDGK